MEEKWKQLQAKWDADEDWARKIFGTQTAEEVQALAQAAGIELTLDESGELKKRLEIPVGELSDEALEGVAGGVRLDFDRVYQEPRFGPFDPGPRREPIRPRWR